MTALDASVLIAHLDEGDIHNARAGRVVVGNSTVLTASTVTLAEVLVGPVRSGIGEAVRQGIRALGVEELPLPVDAAVRLASLRVETGLRLPDCCVILSAEDGDRQLATFNDRLARVARERGLTVTAS